jgi:hypothetical protein
MTDLTLTAAQVAPVFPTEAEIFDFVCGATITQGQAVRQNTAGKAALADANAGSGAEKFRGLALAGGGAGQGISVLKRGHVHGFDLSGVAYDGLVYLSDTAGALADAPSATNPVPVGRVVALADANATKVLYLDADWSQPALPSGNFFKSTEQTGTGSSQDVAHGLGVVPRLVIVYPTDTSPATVGSYAMTEGSHDATNVKVTVTSGKKYKVVAFA